MSVNACVYIGDLDGCSNEPVVYTITPSTAIAVALNLEGTDLDKKFDKSRSGKKRPLYAIGMSVCWKRGFKLYRSNPLISLLDSYELSDRHHKKVGKHNDRQY
jgi:hypothetical protein